MLLAHWPPASERRDATRPRVDTVHSIHRMPAGSPLTAKGVRAIAVGAERSRPGLRTDLITSAGLPSMRRTLTFEPEGSDRACSAASSGSCGARGSLISGAEGFDPLSGMALGAAARTASEAASEPVSALDDLDWITATASLATRPTSLSLGSGKSSAAYDCSVEGPALCRATTSQAPEPDTALLVALGLWGLQAAASRKAIESRRSVTFVTPTPLASQR